MLTGRPLPPGWLGKPHACQQLADAADPAADVLVFVDADVRARARARSRPPSALLGELRPGLRRTRGSVAGTAAERLVQPLLQWSWLTFLPLRLAERSPRPSLSAANGQLLAVRRAAYDRAGGHAAVRAEVLEDVALLRAVKRAGGRGGVADGTALADCRMYARLARAARRLHQVAVGGVRVAGRGGRRGRRCSRWPTCVPPLGGAAPARATGLAGYAAGVTGRVVTARRTGGRAWPDALAHPVSVAAVRRG